MATMFPRPSSSRTDPRPDRRARTTRRAVLAAGIGLAAASAARAAGAGGGRLLAWIAVEADGIGDGAGDGGPVLFRPMALSDRAARVGYRLAVTRIGAGGRTTTSQGGTAALEAGAATALSTVSVTLAAGDAYTAELTCRAEDGTETAVSIASPPGARS